MIAAVLRVWTLPQGHLMTFHLSSPSIHFRHQSEEEASAMQVAHKRSTEVLKSGEVDSSNDKPEDNSTLYLNNPKAVASQDSEWWKLLKKINEVIKTSGNSAPESAQGQSTGLNRRNRWTTTEKVSAGSSIYATSGHVTSGNVTNAQATAQRLAQNVSGSISLSMCHKHMLMFHKCRL